MVFPLHTKFDFSYEERGVGTFKNRRKKRTSFMDVPKKWYAKKPSYKKLQPKLHIQHEFKNKKGSSSHKFTIAAITTRLVIEFCFPFRFAVRCSRSWNRTDQRWEYARIFFKDPKFVSDTTAKVQRTSLVIYRNEHLS